MRRKKRNRGARRTKKGKEQEKSDKEYYEAKGRTEWERR